MGNPAGKRELLDRTSTDQLPSHCRHLQGCLEKKEFSLTAAYLLSKLTVVSIHALLQTLHT